MVSTRTLILECGLNRLSFGIFSRRGARLCLHHFATVPFGSPASVPADAHWLEHACAGFRSLAGSRSLRGPVLLILPAHLTLIKAVKIPRLEATQREKILRFEAGQAIPYALADVVWDSVVVNETATECEVLLAAAKLEVLDPLCAAAIAAGFEPRLVLPASFATLAGFKLLQRRDRGTGILRAGDATTPDLPGGAAEPATEPATTEDFLGLNLGPRSTTLVSVESGRCSLRTFAVSLEPPVGWPSPEGVAAVETVEPARTRLLQEVTRSLRYFQRRSGPGELGQVCLTGDGATLPGLVAALSAKFSVPVVVPNLRGVLDFANDAAARAATDHARLLLDLMGAAATQLQANHAVVNLLPAGGRQRVSQRRRRPWLAAAAVLAMFVLLPPSVHFRRVRDEALKKNAAIERELAPLRLRDLRLRENLQRLAAVEQQVGAIEEIHLRRSSWLHLLASLQDRLGQVEDVWLEKIQVAPALPGAPLRLLVSGRMLDRTHPLAKVSPETFVQIKKLVARLGDSPFIAAVEAERFDNQQPGVLKFDFVLVAAAQPAL